MSDQLNSEGNETTYIRTDVTSEEDVKNLIDATVEKYGSVDVLFANAGIGGMTVVHETDYSE